MPSPFPGMNPWLEQDDAWHDFHERFLPEAAVVLAQQLLPDFFVKIDEHVFVHELPPAPREQLGRPDLAITRGWAEPTGATQVGLLEAPAMISLLDVDVERISYLKILDRLSREVVCVVELLSPSNKRTGGDRDQYLAKRRQTLSSPAHFVEIDLLRGGPPMPADDRPRCDYSVMVSRVEMRPQAQFWPIDLRDRLPIVPVPAREPRPEARLDLQIVLDRIYDLAEYQYYVYGGRPDPPLSTADAAWAAEILR